MNRILIVDDDVGLTELLREYLEIEGFTVETLHDGAACLRTNMDEKDLVVLDVMLPAVSGLEVLKWIRHRSNVPVIMLTARDGEIDKVVGLEMGADDYVPKPVNPRELVARIRAVLRRMGSTEAAATGELAVGAIRLDGASRSAWSGDRKLDLTTAEFNLLQHLLRNAGRIVSREEISAVAFGRRFSSGADRNVDTLVSKVRRKLGRASEMEDRIKTIRNVGYLYALISATDPEAHRSPASIDE
ncbi:MAG: DNA-binding response regulator [Rhodospirillales bacterium]|nr:DNA-binding response regulator [Rhodospirillales bacterium]